LTNTGYLLCKRHGSLVYSVTTPSRHQEPDTAAEQAFIVSEFRNRQFIAVFCYDKTLSAMTGRPPLLGHRYSTCLLPLDLSDDQLMTEEPELGQIKNRLDTYGWNTLREVYASTEARAFLLINLVREDILETSLSTSNDSSELIKEYVYRESKRSQIQDRCADIIRRCDAIYTRFPQSIRFNAKQHLSTIAHLFPRRIGLRLIYLHFLFLLERLSISHTKASAQRLVDLATQLLDDVLTL
jgi:hypothetical protein